MPRKAAREVHRVLVPAGAPVQVTPIIPVNLRYRLNDGFRMMSNRATMSVLHTNARWARVGSRKAMDLFRHPLLSLVDEPGKA